VPIFIGRGAAFGYSEGLAGVCGFKQDSRSRARDGSERHRRFYLAVDPRPWSALSLLPW